MALSDGQIQMILKATDEASAALQHVNKELKGVGDASDTAKHSTSGLGDAAGKAFDVMKIGALAAGAAMAGIMAVSVSSAAEFEKTMSGVKAVSGASVGELEQLSSLALKLGKDTVFSASEAAKGIEELVKGGISIADILGGAATASLNLATAGEIDLASAAEIAANAMNQFGLKGGDMAHVSDMIAGAANASSLSVMDFKFSLGQVGAVAAVAGQSFDSTAQAIAVLGAAGIKGSDAGTSLKQFLLSINPTSKPAIAALTELGIVTKDGGNAFFDAAGKAKSMRDISQVLSDATANLTEQEKLKTLSVIFGSDAMRAAAVLAKSGAEGFDTMAAAMGKVTAASVAAERLNNLAGDMEQLKGSLETGAITLGMLFLPALREAAKGATEFVNAAIPWIEEHGPQFMDLLTQIGTAGVEGFTALSGAVSAVVKTGSDLVKFFQDNILAANMLVAAIAGVTFAALVAGAPAAIGALAALAIGFGATALAAGSAAVAMAAAALPFLAIAAVIGAVVLAGMTIIDNWNLISFVAQAMALVVGTAFARFGEVVGGTISAVLGAIGGFLSALGERVGAIPGLFGQAFDTAGQLIQAGITAAWAFITETVPFWAGFIVGWLSTLPDQVGTLFAQAGQFIMDRLTEAWTWVTEQVPTWPDAIGGFLASIGTFVGTRFQEAKQAVLDKLTEAWNWVSSNVSTWPANIFGFLSTLASLVLARFHEAKEAIASKLTDAWNWVSTELPTWPGKIFDFMSAIPGKIGEALAGVAQAITKPFTDAWNTVSGIWANIQNAAASVGASVGNAFGAGQGAGQAAGGGVPAFANGGVVPGQVGAPILALVHGGELVVPPGRWGGGAGMVASAGAGGGPVTIQVTVPFTNYGVIGIDELRAMLDDHIRDGLARGKYDVQVA